MAALRRMNDDGVRVELGSDQPLDLRAAQHFRQHRAVTADQNQSSGWVLLDPQPAVAVHRVGHLDQKRAGHGIAAERRSASNTFFASWAAGRAFPRPSELSRYV